MFVRSEIRVLLVEDDPEFAELTRTRVRESDDRKFQVEWTDDLQKAMNRLAQPGIDVVLLDFGMLELGHRGSGADITKMVGTRIPVVILTSDESTLSRHLTVGYGAVDYLVKRRTSAVELKEALQAALVPPRYLSPASLRLGDDPKIRLR